MTHDGDGWAVLDQMGSAPIDVGELQDVAFDGASGLLVATLGGAIQEWDLGIRESDFYDVV